jgi:putative FmdB family regulatory protein
MPTYDYVCTACGTRVEVIHGVNESGPTVCISCGGSMRKALSLPTVVFKGSGWAKKERASGASKADGRARSDDGDDKPADGKPVQAKAGEAGAPTGATSEPAKGGGGSTD